MIKETRIEKSCICDWKLVTDSGCGLLVPDKCCIGHEVVPFSVTVAGKNYMEDADVEAMLTDVGSGGDCGKTGCPSPKAWLDAFGDAENVVAFTLSAALSGSYNSAIAAKHMALDKNPDRNIYIVNTCGAGIMPEYIVRRMIECIKSGDTFDEITETAEEIFRNIQVMFALGSLENLIKAGRLGRIVGYAAHRLGISAIGVASPGGRIELRHKFRGVKKIYGKLLESLREQGFRGGELVITHCDNQDGAEKLGHLIKAEWLDTEVTVIPASLICGYYMGKGGLIVTYV